MAAMASMMSANHSSRADSQGNRFCFGLDPHLWTKTVGGSNVDVRTQHLGKLTLEGSKREQASARRQVNEQVDIAVGLVLSTGDTAEHPDVARSMAAGGGQHGCPALSQPLRARNSYRVCPHFPQYLYPDCISRNADLWL